MKHLNAILETLDNLYVILKFFKLLLYIMSELWNIEVLEFFNSRFEYRIINQSKINSTQKSRNSVRSNYS